MTSVDAIDRLVAALDPEAESEARLALPAAERGRLGFLPGSFNPPTCAHLELAAAGRRAGLDCVYYVLSKRTVDKEQVSGIPLADRLRLLAALARSSGDGVVFANRGLYVEIAAALGAALPRASELVFLVGHDKIVQIFDPRYYVDRDSALSDLFARARFMVAPRGTAERDALELLLDRPENRRFAPSVEHLPLSVEFRDASSTGVRSGEDERVPPEVASYLRTHRPFARAG